MKLVSLLVLFAVSSTAFASANYTIYKEVTGTSSFTQDSADVQSTTLKKQIEEANAAARADAISAARGDLEAQCPGENALRIDVVDMQFSTPNSSTQVDFSSNGIERSNSNKTYVFIRAICPAGIN